jgi:GAF domain-containing protein
VGDRIVAIDGDRRLAGGVRWTNTLWLKLRDIPPDRAFSMTVAREGAPGDIELRLEAPLSRDPSRWGRLLPVLIVSIVFGLNAMLIGFSRPEEPVVRIAFLSALAEALILLMNVLAPLTEVMSRGELIGYFLLCVPLPLHLALNFDFTSRFPIGVPANRLMRWLRVLFYVWAFALFVVFRWTHASILFGEESARATFAEYAGVLAVVWRAYDAFVMASMVSACVVLGRNYRRVREPDGRRRIRWVVYGMVAGIGPWMLLSLARVILPDDYELAAGVLQVANLALAIIPITTAYAIIKHRAFDIHVVIRRGLQYLFAKGVLRGVLALQIVGIALLFALNRERTVGELLTHNSAYLYLFGTTALTLGFRGRLSQWIDRKFFRASYEGERILVSLASEIRKLDSMPEICRLVCHEVDAALHPQGVHFFYRDSEREGELTVGHSTSADSGKLRFLEGSSLLRWLEGREGAAEVPREGDSTLSTADWSWLQEHAVELLVPISSSDGHLVGLLLLGAKRSEEPFSARDRKLLDAIAAQIAVVLENALLKSRVSRERRVREEVLSKLTGTELNLLRECPTCGACFDNTAERCDRDGSELSLSLPVDRVVDGKYRLDQVLGKGGMGAVYRATDLRLDRQVAVKILHGSRFGDAAALRRFEREARASARLNHPNITAVHDYGRVGADGAYLVMELLPGRTLRAELKQTRNPSPPAVAAWFEQVLEGVRAAHAAGVIHRDLKPENVMISAAPDGRPTVKILDFGIAKLGFADEALSSPGFLLGTIAYMSPEQLEGREADVRSDLFAIAVMAFEAMSGRRPFAGASYSHLLSSMRAGPARLPGEAPEVRGLQVVLERALRLDPQARFATAEELRAELIPAMRACPPLPRETVVVDEDTRALTR